MISSLKHALAIGVCIVIAAPAYAQVCKESSSSSTGGAGGGAAPSGGGGSYGGSGNSQTVQIDCDHTYRDKVITCDSSDNTGTRPSCPPRPMPMIKTPLASYIGNYSHDVYTYPRDKNDVNKAYSGLYATGTPGGSDKVYNVLGNSAGVDKALAACTNQLVFPQSFSSSTSKADEAKMVRLQLDNCTNQYILRWAVYPFQKERSRLLNNPESSTNPSAPISLETECQPLKTFEETENEYSVSEYLRVAWVKTLQDPEYRKTKSLLGDMPGVITTVLGLAGINVPNAIANSSEPHLPKNVKIQNPIAPPEPFPEVRLSQVAALKYEEILDPTHPFSPRWDFSFTEREFYSPLTKSYMNETKNVVYCAGVREDQNSSGQEKKDKEVPVDVLKFRKKAFDDGMLRRIAFNTLCYNDNQGEQDGEFFTQLVTPMNYCVKMNIANMITCYSPYATNCDKTGTRHNCWDCFKLDGKLDADDDPPCSTHHGGEDLKLRMFPYFPAINNGFGFKASCNPNPLELWFKKDKHDIDKLCNDLRRPYTQINKVKMRYDNPDDKDNNVLIDGVPEGYRFKDYFDNHMPYPRLWDTGKPLLKSASNVGNYQPPEDTTGQYTTVVGVGREGAPQSAGSDAQKNHPDERCKLGGWGGWGVGGVTVGMQQQGFMGAQGFSLPDPLTSWTELKLYQMRTLRLANLSCIGRYEKVFKPGSSENVVLMALGGEWSRVVVSRCPKQGQSGSCTYMSMQEYQQGGQAGDPTSTYTIVQSKQESWPLGWRGYMSTGTASLGSIANSAQSGGSGLSLTDTQNQFPNFGPTVGAAMGLTAFKQGLDNAQLGDIVMMPRGATKISNTRPGLAKVALVSEVNLPDASVDRDCEDRKDCYIQVMEADNGKWPDVCGTTDTWGEIKTRYFYKPGHLPKAVKKELEDINASVSCENTKLARCEFQPWSEIRLYRVRENVRTGCTQGNAEECGG